MGNSNRTQHPPAALIFDLDGTLLDSYASHMAAYETMLAQFDIHISRSRLLDVYSPDWFAVYLALGLPREKWPEADKVWLAAAAEHQPALFPGVPELLEELATTFPLALVTSGSGHRVHRDLARTGLARFFSIVVTGDDVDTPKPDPQGLLAAAGRIPVDPRQALYIGDTPTDHATARAAGMPFAGVSSPMLNGNRAYPFVMLPSVRDLPPYLAQLRAP